MTNRPNGTLTLRVSSAVRQYASLVCIFALTTTTSGRGPRAAGQLGVVNKANILKLVEVKYLFSGEATTTVGRDHERSS